MDVRSRSICQNPARCSRPVSAVEREPGSVTSDVQARLCQSCGRWGRAGSVIEESVCQIFAHLEISVKGGVIDWLLSTF